MIAFFDYFLAIATILIVPTSAFTTSHTRTSSSTSTSSRTTKLRMVSRDEYLQPHFHFASATASTASSAGAMLRPPSFGTPLATPAAAAASPIRSSSSSSSLEQRVQDYCHDKGGCDLEEMARLMEEFKQVNESPSSLFHFEETKTSQPDMKEESKAYDEVNHNVDLKQHLLRMHEIADMEEH
eukprot:CAMPEP_0113631896 /NCGR_PEP_ID=MMETSP0017_2-20120614/16575_1 /TAXON_ID=2856 /ORGANISM="Cylindrotheca closterium" /LENGTH=182 /DNA_ID=CAMNT_0000542423 /DNA_START=165 /DNA_END=713 /DNA_ORIENTATION=- /assembly_acc=CAM_ASM_000147